MRVVADTSPLNYLTLIGSVDILPTLFTAVSIPASVERELRHSETPDVVRDWINATPPWLTARPVSASDDSALMCLHDGERDTILLAHAVEADLVLIDERAGVAAARARGLSVTGALGLLDRAGQHGLLDFPGAIARLQTTSFRCRPALLIDLLERHRIA